MIKHGVTKLNFGAMLQSMRNSVRNWLIHLKKSNSPTTIMVIFKNSSESLYLPAVFINQ